MIKYEDFEKVDIRLGKIVEVIDFPEARNPSYKLKIDFGKEVGIKKSVAGIKDLYDIKDLEGTFVLGVVNFPPKQIGPTISECLTLGIPNEDSEFVLIRPDKPAKIGGKLF